ncbi:MAG: CGNR zinc finger domain-containing protein [Chloroflexota bacterium]
MALDVDALIVIASSTHGPEGHLGLPRSGVRQGPAHDHLADARAARDFLAPRREFDAPAGAPPPSELRRLRLVRDAVRALARGDTRSYARRRDALLHGASYRLAPDGTLESPNDGWTAFCDLLVPPLVALGTDRPRLRACGNRRCGWLFIDRSANGRRRWCDPKACGNRMKVRRYRARN